jgi:hypothetical protein
VSRPANLGSNVFLDLLKRQSELIAELFLRHSFFEAQGTHAPADFDIQRILLFIRHFE